jgi:hypothetical protein
MLKLSAPGHQEHIHFTSSNTGTIILPGSQMKLLMSFFVGGKLGKEGTSRLVYQCQVFTRETANYRTAWVLRVGVTVAGSVGWGGANQIMISCKDLRDLNSLAAAPLVCPLVVYIIIHIIIISVGCVTAMPLLRNSAFAFALLGLEAAISNFRIAQDSYESDVDADCGEM